MPRPQTIDSAVPEGPAPRLLRTAAVLGLGRALPERTVTNAPIAERLGIDEQWIVRRTGIEARRYARDDERLSDLAAGAALGALEDAGVDPQEVDVVLVATLSSDEITPNAAPLVAHAIGATRAGAMDVGAACTGFLSALQVGSSLVESGRARYVLVIGAEMLSRFTDFDDKRTAALFGDGAGAVLLGEGPGAVGDILLRSDGGLADAIVATRDEPWIRMDGHATFLAAVNVLAESTLEVCDRAGVDIDDVDLFVFHQANRRITTAVAERLRLPEHRVADYIDRIGNTSAASIPLALSLARDAGRLRPGDRVVLAAVGAGFVWGAGLVEWGGPL